MVNKFLIIGQGSIGSKVSNILAADSLFVTGMARHDRSKYIIEQSVGFIQADATKIGAEHIAEFSHVLVVVSPTDYSTQGYKDSYLAIVQNLSKLDLPNLKRIVFISSTGVYGQDSGEWIDETTEPQLPQRESSQIIWESEQLLQQAFTDKCVIIRPSGIYGANRLMRIRKAAEVSKSVMPEFAWTNRIMDTDLVTIIAKVLTVDETKPMYLATDYLPVTSFALTTWLCQKLAFELPKSATKLLDNNITDIHQLEHSGKRIKSNIPKEWLLYPDWKSGYRFILTNLGHI